MGPEAPAAGSHVKGVGEEALEAYPSLGVGEEALEAYPSVWWWGSTTTVLGPSTPTCALHTPKVL